LKRQAVIRHSRPRKQCWALELEIYEDKSGFEISGGWNHRFMGPTKMGGGVRKLRAIAKWLNEIADWSEASERSDE
jgi:hypothetical protein